MTGYRIVCRCTGLIVSDAGVNWSYIVGSVRGYIVGGVRGIYKEADPEGRLLYMDMYYPD